MIQLIRLDERLLHGQVAVKWLSFLDIDSILVVDDKTARDQMASKIMLMSASVACSSSKIKTSIKTINDAIKLLNDPRAKAKKIFVVTRELTDLRRLVNEAPDVKEINIGNYGTLQPTEETRREIVPRLYLNSKEVEVMRDILNSGLEVNFQVTPDYEKIDLAKKL